MTYVSQMTTLGVITPRRAQQQYGISAESLEEIQNRAGKPSAEVPIDEEQLTLDQSQVIIKLRDALQYQAVQFDRYRELTEQKFTTLSKDLLDLSMQLKETKGLVDKYKDKLEVRSNRAALHRYQQGDKPAVDMPIDRNGVAPKDVQIDNIFNFSGRR